MIAAFHAAQPERHLDVLGRGQHGDQPEILEDVADAVASGGGQFGLGQFRQYAQ